MITEISGEQLNNLRFELRQLNTELNGLFRSVNENRTVEVIRYLDQAKDRLDALLTKIGWYE